MADSPAAAMAEAAVASAEQVAQAERAAESALQAASERVAQAERQAQQVTDAALMTRLGEQVATVQRELEQCRTSEQQTQADLAVLREAVQKLTAEIATLSVRLSEGHSSSTLPGSRDGNRTTTRETRETTVEPNQVNGENQDAREDQRTEPPRKLRRIL